MFNEIISLSLPFGLLELDASGTVLYFKPERKEVSTPANTDIIGRNFFADIPVVAEAKEFQSRLHSFRRNHAPADSFTCTFPSEHGYVRAKILLARIHEHSTLGNVDSILVHIREAA
jgi:hypothetical protein